MVCLIGLANVGEPPPRHLGYRLGKDFCNLQIVCAAKLHTLRLILASLKLAALVFRLPFLF